MLPGALFVSPYLTAGSGRVFNLTTGFDNNGDGVFTDRPAVVAAGTLGAIQTPYGWLLADRPYDAVMVARNAGREPWTARLDVRVLRSFRFSTTGGVTVAANIENVLNPRELRGFQRSGDVIVVRSAQARRDAAADQPRRKRELLTRSRNPLEVERLRAIDGIRKPVARVRRRTTATTEPSQLLDGEMNVRICQRFTDRAGARGSSRRPRHYAAVSSRRSCSDQFPAERAARSSTPGPIDAASQSIGHGRGLSGGPMTSTFEG
jgi:hypothetical protein